MHEGLLANDVVSFHTPRWRRNFLRSCEDILDVEPDFEPRRVTLAATAHGAGARDLRRPRGVRRDRRERGRAASGGGDRGGRPEHLILRVDRTDPSKNVVRGFRAYELYLEAHPEMHGRVQMLALLDPSRQDIPEYAEYLGAIQRAARAVNDRFQQESWVPLDLQIEDNFQQAVAAYKQFDVLLVNAIFDGMNLVAKEAPLVNTRDGVLLLSENAGAHDELGEWALTVNPFDVAGQAEAIHQALTMASRGAPAPARGDRCARAGARHRRWIEAQLADLDEARERAVCRPRVEALPPEGRSACRGGQDRATRPVTSPGRAALRGRGRGGG